MDRNLSKAFMSILFYIFIQDPDDFKSMVLPTAEIPDKKLRNRFEAILEPRRRSCAMKLHADLDMDSDYVCTRGSRDELDSSAINHVKEDASVCHISLYFWWMDDVKYLKKARNGYLEAHQKFWFRRKFWKMI